MVFDLIRHALATNRAELTRATDTSPQTVSNIIAELEAARLIEPTGRIYGGIGQPPVTYRLNRNAGHAIGIHVDRGHLHGVRVDAAMNVLAEEEGTLDATSAMSVHRGVRALAETLTEPARRNGVPIWGLGLAAPRLVDARVRGRRALEGRLWAELHNGGFDEILSRELDLAVIVENDANAGALGEAASLPPPTPASFCYLFIGRGLGCCIVERGQLVRGAWRNAGEIGRIPLPDAAGQSIETILSVDGLLAQARVSTRPPLARTLASLDQRHPLQVCEWLGRAAPLLRWLTAMIETMLDPACIIVGSYLPRPLLERLIAETSPLRHSIAVREARPLPRLFAGMKGHGAVAFGAAMTPLLAALDEAPDESWVINGSLPDVYAAALPALAAGRMR